MTHFKHTQSVDDQQVIKPQLFSSQWGLQDNSCRFYWTRCWMWSYENCVLSIWIFTALTVHFMRKKNCGQHKTAILHLCMMISESHQISVNSFWLVLRPRLLSLFLSSLIGVSVLVGGSWIGEVSACIASTAEGTCLSQTKQKTTDAWWKTPDTAASPAISELILQEHNFSTMNDVSGHHKCVLKVQIKLSFETQPRCSWDKVFNHLCGVHL